MIGSVGVGFVLIHSIVVLVVVGLVVTGLGLQVVVGAGVLVNTVVVLPVPDDLEGFTQVFLQLLNQSLKSELLHFDHLSVSL